MESSLNAGSTVESFLSANPLFYSLSESVLSSIAEKVQLVEFEPGQNIVIEGEIGDSFYLIKEGRVRVLKRTDEDSSELVLSELGQAERCLSSSISHVRPRFVPSGVSRHSSSPKTIFKGSCERCRE